MKMSILEIEYKNIRKISELKLTFDKKNNFIMMANGTGKTTTMTLLKGLFDGSAESWPAVKVKSFAPTTVTADEGEFIVTVKFDDKLYKYFLTLNYISGEARISTLTSAHGGREERLYLPDSLSGIFTKEFVNRFIFDGEQAEKSMDSSSNEAEDTITYLYRLDMLEEILTINERILSEIQATEGSKGSDGSLSNLRTRQNNLKKVKIDLEARANELQKEISLFEEEKKSKELQKSEIDQSYNKLNQEKMRIAADVQKNKSDIDSKTTEILELIKSPFLFNAELSDRMLSLGSSMRKLKLPKTTAKDFFTELANAEYCVCGRPIDEHAKETILANADKYLGGDQQAVLNQVKSSLNECFYDDRLKDAFNDMSVLKTAENKLDTARRINEEKLLEAGGDKAKALNDAIIALAEKISTLKSQLDSIESTDDNNPLLTENNNIHKAALAIEDYEQKIASASKTNAALQKKKIVENLVREIQKVSTDRLKDEIIRKTNEKLKTVITDDNIEIESIDHYIKLKGRDGASEGQTLSIAYCFLGTLFEDAELEFPFIIDSPTGKMDFDKRQAVADIIPQVFNQMIAFVQSAEVERFADRFYNNDNSQFITIITDMNNEKVVKIEGKDFFDSYQREHREEGV